MNRVSIGDVALNVADQGAGVPLLLVHGFPLDHSMWQAQIEALSAHCRVIAPDLRGFGASDVTAGAVPMEQFAGDLSALLDAMNVAEPVTFCGLSMGGYIAWPFWARHRPRLAKLILCDTRAAADSAEAAAGRHKSAERVLADGAQVIADAMLPKLFAQETSERRPDIVRATQEVMLRTNPEGIAAALRGMAARPDYTPRLREIDVPTLLLCGERDGITTPHEMRGIAQQIPGAQFFQIAEAGHMAPLEAPAAVNARIIEFLAS